MKTLLLAAAFAMGTSAVSAAALVIDDFSTYLEAQTNGAPGSVNTVTDDGVGAIGDREFTVVKNTGGVGLNAATASLPNVGLSLSSDGGVQASHGIKYGADTSLDLNVSMFNTISFDVSFLDLAPVVFGATLWDSNGSQSADVLLDATSPPGYAQSIDLSSFDLINLEDIQMIGFTFGGLEGADLILENISFEVPVPAALPLLLTGLAGFALLRMRRKA